MPSEVQSAFDVLLEALVTSEKRWKFAMQALRHKVGATMQPCRDTATIEHSDL